MPAVDTTQIFVGSPDQATSGAIYDAPLTATTPTTVDAALTGFTSSGYITSDGVTLTPTYNTTDLTDWSGANVRKILENFEGEITWSEMQFDENSLARAFGSTNVSTTAANSSHGKQVTVQIGAEQPPARQWAFKIKDGDRKVLIVVPNGQITQVDAITFNSTDSINLPLTLSCYPDSSGKSIYIYTDDGKKTSV